MDGKALFERAEQLIPGGVNSPVRAFRSVGGTPFFTAKARGAKLTTFDGDELIDFVGTWGPAIHGHNDPEIRSAVADALENGTSFGTPTPREVDMAERIVRRVPSVEKVRACNSGTEATMSSIRVARGYTGRSKVIKFAGCYHGHVDSLLVSAGSGAMTFGHPSSAGVPEAFASETLVVDFNDVPGVEEAFREHGDDVAAVILEPYPANCGMILPDDGFLAKLRELCSERGAVLIFDEVMTGFRVAPGGVQELTGVTPDLTAMGKIIGGGLPVGAFGGRADIMDCLSPEGPVYQAGTLSGNPLAMAAGIASLDKLAEEQPYRRLEALGRQVEDAANEAAREHGLPLQVARAGSMFVVFFADRPVRTAADAAASDTDRFAKLFHYALDRGVYLPPSQFETCFISTAHEGADIDRACQVIADGIRSL